MVFRQFGVAATVTVALALATPAYAVTEIQWWHAMTGGNNDIVNKLADDFNASQSDYKVVPTFQGSYPDTLAGSVRRRQKVKGCRPRDLRLLQRLGDLGAYRTILGLAQRGDRQQGKRPRRFRYRARVQLADACEASAEPDGPAEGQDL